MLNAFSAQAAILRQDRWLLALLTWLPAALALLLWAIFHVGIARDLPIAVVDLSHSELSQRFLRQLDASPVLHVAKTGADLSAAKDALVQGEIYAYLVIPNHFDRDILLGRAPQISAFYNSQYVLVAKLVSSALSQAHATFNAQISTLQALAAGNSTLSSAMAKAVPVRSQITPLFNQNSDYAQFLVTGIVPALWQIMMVVSSVMILSANQRQVGLNAWLNRAPLRQLCATLLPYLPLFCLQGMAFLLWFYQSLAWPFAGGFGVVLAAQLLTAVACMLLGALFYFLTLDAARAISFAGALTAPSFAFMGITFPVSDMGMLARSWRSLLPISHYIEVQLAQASYASQSWLSLAKALPLVSYLALLLPIGYLISRQLDKTKVQP